MLNLKKKLILGASSLALLSSVCLYPQNKTSQNSEKSSENKSFSHSIENQIQKTEKESINPKRKEFVENARKYLNEEYSWGGRLTEKNPGIDCLGLIFLAYSETYNMKWTEFSVNPSKIVKKEQLGKPVKGLEGVLVKDIDFSKLEEGDIIYLLTTSKINDTSLAEINKIKYWPWHTGIYSDKKNNLLLHAEPGNKVVESNFKNYLDWKTKAIFVTRIY